MPGSNPEEKIVQQHGERLEFERIDLTSAYVFDPKWLGDMIANADHTTHQDLLKDRHISEMRAFILGMDSERVTASWPTTWWDHLKFQFAPQWFLKRWPIQFTKIDKKIYGKVFLSVFPDRVYKHHKNERRSDDFFHMDSMPELRP